MTDELWEHVETENAGGTHCYVDGEDWPCLRVAQRRTIDGLRAALDEALVLLASADAPKNRPYSWSMAYEELAMRYRALGDPS